MWIETEIEKYMREQISQDFNDNEAKTYLSQYDYAKSYLENNIYSFIATKEPGLTDHSDKHIENVLKNLWFLINDEKNRFNSIELYLLCLCVLFHDSGNINGREGHNKKIADIYEEIIGNDSRRLQERRLVLSIVKAHCGESIRGDKDTLIEVDEKSDLYSKEIKTREIAGIIRFADELAEGPQRTSDFLLKNGTIDSGSIIYHKYASITNIFIDKGNGRVALTYNIEYPVNEVEISKLLECIYKRIIKLDLERRYCKYYSSVLDKFKRTDAQINICHRGEDLIDLPKIELGDKYLISDETEDCIIFSRYPQLKTELVITELEKQKID